MMRQSAKEFGRKLFCVTARRQIYDVRLISIGQRRQVALHLAGIPTAAKRLI